MKQKLFLFLTFLLLTSFLFAQEQGNGITENSDTIYVIREMEFDIEGRTRPYALVFNGEFREGERISGKENFDKYLADKTQLLLNQRVLEDVRIEYSLGKSEEDGALPVKLFVYVKDTWNLVVLPYPKYDSNEGFSFTIKARDYNFLGTMSALRVDLGYSRENDNNNFNFSLESETPFQAAGLHWIFTFDHFLGYTFGEPLYYQNLTGLALQLPWQHTTFTVGLNQYLTINEENDDENIEIYDLDDRFHGPYGSTELFFAWKIPISRDVGGFGELSYTPAISGRINYLYGEMDEPRKPVTTFKHSIDFGRIDWIGNFRKGLAVSIGNAYNRYIDRDDAPWRITLEGDGIFHWPFSKYIGVSSRLNYRQWWQWSDRNDDWIPYYNAGDLIRGVLDKDIRANKILSLNLDLPVRVLRFWPSEWFNNSKYRFFNFEMHASPFTDLALLHGPYSKLKDEDDPWAEETKFGVDDMINTAGLEVVVFPGFFRSLNLRVSVGYNIRRIKNEGLSRRWGFFPDWDEIFIGLEHHY